MVDRLPEEQGVTGSNPVIGTKTKPMQSQSKAICKLYFIDFVQSKLYHQANDSPFWIVKYFKNGKINKGDNKMEQDLITVEHVKKEDVMYEVGHSVYMECGLPYKKTQFLDMVYIETTEMQSGIALYEQEPFWQIFKETQGDIYIENCHLIFKMNGYDYYFSSPCLPKKLLEQIKNTGSFAFILLNNKDEPIETLEISDTNLCQ